MSLFDRYKMWRWHREQAEAEQGSSVRTPVRSIGYQRAQRYFARERQRALERESDEALSRYINQIRIMENSSEYEGLLLAREAQEIQTEVLHRASLTRSDSAFWGIREIPKVTPKGWPRLNRVTLQALGDEKLLRLRDNEEQLRNLWVRQATEALAELEERGVKLDQILNAEPGARWVEEHCMRDPELAADSLLLVHPDVDVIGGYYHGQTFLNPIWKPPAPKTTLRPI